MREVGNILDGEIIVMLKKNCEKITCVLLVTIIIFVLIAIIDNPICNKLENNVFIANTFFTTFLGGIVGALVSSFFVYKGLREGNKAKQIENQLKLREMFAEERRWEVHNTILTEDMSYWFGLAEKTAMSGAELEGRAESLFIVALWDYLGLLENAKMMLDKGELSPEDFKTSYKYRLEKLKNNSFIKTMLEDNDKEYWKNLQALIDEFCDKD